MAGNLFNPKIVRDRTGWFLVQTLLGCSLLGFTLAEQTLGQTTKPAPAKPAPAKPTPAKPTPEAKPGSRPATKPFLNLGSQGKEVTELQAMLQLLGYYNGAITGEYDQTTSTAVAKFQTAAGLPVDGIVGLETWGRLLPPSPVVTPAPAAPAASKATPDAFPLPTAGNPTVSNSTPAAPTPGMATTAKPASSPSAQAASELVALPILRLGMKGPAVTSLQERLRALGFLKGAADGVFGQETQAAVKSAQRKFSLEADGIVGQGTWLDLMR